MINPKAECFRNYKWNRVYAQTYDGNCFTNLSFKNHKTPQQGAVRTELNQNFKQKPFINQVPICVALGLNLALPWQGFANR